MENNNKKGNKIIIVKLKRIIIMCIAALFSVSVIIFASGCFVFGLFGEKSSEEDESLKVPEVEIDEREIEEIGKGEENMKKSYEAETDIDIIDESSRDPFKPFYISEEDEGEEKNILKLEEIFSKEGVDYADINLNDYTYKLKVGDTLKDIYAVMAINDDSVVLQKGDELITLFIDIPLYD